MSRRNHFPKRFGRLRWVKPERVTVTKAHRFTRNAEEEQRGRPVGRQKRQALAFRCIFGHSMVVIIIYQSNGAGFASRILPTGEAVPLQAVWIDLFQPSADEEAAIEAMLAFDVPTREEMRTIEPSNLLYSEAGANFMAARIVTHGDEGTAKLAPVSFILAGKRLITVRYDAPRSFELFRQKLERGAECGPRAEHIFMELMETIIDRAAELLQAIGERIDEVNSDAFNPNVQFARGKGARYRAILNQLGQEGDRIAKVRESMVSIERMLLFLSTRIENAREVAGLRSELKTTLRDVESLEDHATFLNDKIQFLLDGVLGLVSLDQNNIVKIFSVAAVVFMPPTLIASIYGMNFEVMPETKWIFGYPMALGMMAVSVIITLLFFKIRKWL
jgi:magnesium transporter